MKKYRIEKMGPVIHNPQQLSQLCEEVSKIAVAAGEEILNIYKTEFSVEHKDDKSPLTAADTAAHQCICAGLEKLAIQIPILSEESAAIAYEERQSWSSYWLVDPLDGTREFIKRNGEFTVNIALIHEQKPILGVVYVPVTGVNYYAAQGIGAFKQTDEEQEKITTRKTDGNNLIIAGSRSHGNEKQQAFMQKVGTAKTLSVGSSLKFCLVAEGKVDIYPRFGLTSEWDTAAAQCVVEQAGGTVCTLDLHALTYNSKDSLLNPEFLVIGDTHFDWLSYLP